MKTVSSTISYKYSTIYTANIYLIFNSNLFRLSDNTKGTKKFIADICEQLASVLTFKVYTKEDLAVRVREGKCQGVRKPYIIQNKLFES